jgi:hypothetical protein
MEQLKSSLTIELSLRACSSWPVGLFTMVKILEALQIRCGHTGYIGQLEQRILLTAACACTGTWCIMDGDSEQQHYARHTVSHTVKCFQFMICCSVAELE